MSGPLISVIVPVYNRAEFLVEAVSSVFAQTLGDWELIIVDDGSTDGTRAACERIADDGRAQVFSVPHSGNPAVVRNAALRVARGEFVSFLDSDDRWRRDKLEVQLGQLRSEPRRLWSYTGFEHIDAAGVLIEDGVAERWSPCEGQIFAATVTGRAPIRTASVDMATRSVLLEAGGFDEQLISGQDYDLWMRIAFRNPAAVTRARLTDVRVHAGSHSSRRPTRALECRELSLRKVEALAGRDWQPLIAAQRRRNAASLAANYLAEGARGEMLASMGRNLAMCWRDPRWWASSARTLLRALGPSARGSGGVLAR